MTDPRLSPLTIGWGIFIVISASFMLQVNNWLTAAVGDPALKTAFWCASIILIIAVTLRVSVARLGIVHLVGALVLFAIGYYVGTWHQHFAEKTHILTYGLLGFLAARDLIDGRRGERPFGVWATIAFLVVVSAADEGLQYILPYRFGEVKDFLTNVMSGFLGMGLYATLRSLPTNTRS